VAQVASHIDPVEPRFVLYAYSRGTVGTIDRGTAVVFIYSCPDKSKLRTRMVYSTSKPWIVHEAQAAGLNVARKMEIRSPEDASPQAINEALHPSSYSAGGGGGAASRPAGSPSATRSYQTVSKPHPVYSQIAPETAHASLKKKIVMPPSGAW
jgi:hypothetical protein